MQDKGNLKPVMNLIPFIPLFKTFFRLAVSNISSVSFRPSSINVPASNQLLFRSSVDINITLTISTPAKDSSQRLQVSVGIRQVKCFMTNLCVCVKQQQHCNSEMYVHCSF